MTLTGQMLATYISQAYVSAIGIICVPLQVSALGLEGYGLVGVLVMLQAWFLLLDFGRVALITRKAAHIDDLLGRDNPCYQHNPPIVAPQNIRCLPA